MSADIIACRDLDDAFRAFSLRRDCDVIGDNTLRIATPFLNPDGSFIDLFLEQAVALDRPDQGLLKGYILSDLGETSAYLYGLRIKLASRKRRKMISDICDTLSVEFDRGEFRVRFEPGELGHLADAMIRLAQACIRVADFAFSQRFPAPGVFWDDVEEYIEQLDVPYDPEPELFGKFAKPVQVDFRVKGPHKPSLVKIVAPSTPEIAHQMLNEALSRWISLSDYRAENQLFTVVQDRDFSYRSDDLDRLKMFSDGIFQFPSERSRFKQSLLGEPVPTQ